MSGIKSRLGRIAHAVASAYDRKRFSRRRDEFAADLTFTGAAAAFPSRNQLYAYMHHYFLHRLPPQLKAHRDYFSKESRGFGEEAFHAMWYLLFKEFKPLRLLEIGVFRGQVISLWRLIGRMQGLDTDIHCISPFSSAGDSVSKYPTVNFLEDVLQNFRHFNLAEPRYLKAFSTDRAAVSYMQSQEFDCIYIDGSHDYEVVLSDYRNSVAALKPGGLLVMDDSSLHTDFKAPAFSFAGHAGPSKVAREFADRDLVFIAGVGHQNVYQKR